MIVSIIIPNYNGEKYLINCLNSLYNQTFKTFDIILVDNGSSDNSINIAYSHYPQIKLIRLDSNLGFSKAINEGIKAAKGKYVVLLNNDTEVEGEWLKWLVEGITKDHKVFSCCSKMLKSDEHTKIDDAGDEYTLLGWTLKNGENRDKIYFDKDKEIFSSCAGAAIYRKEIFDEIGYFDENFFAYMEDVDISYRAKIYGYKNMYCSSAQVYHIGSATSGSKYNSFKVRLAARNNIYVIYKNMPLLQLLINSPFLFIGFLIKALFFYKIGFGREYIEGLREAFKNLKNIEKVKYSNKFLLNYIKIEIEMIINTFRYPLMKLSKLWDK